MSAFFIVGLQRSGTTLLSVMLENNPHITLQRQATAFRLITGFNNLYDLLPYNLQHEKNTFLEWLIENDPGGQLKAFIDLENLSAYASVRELIGGSIEKKIKETGAQIWGDKCPNLQHYLNDLLVLIPQAKFIHIVRDGRANAYSMSKRSYRHLKLSAQMWVDGNVQGLVNQQLIGSQNYQIIHYEDLLREPEKTATIICEFLKVPFNSEMTSAKDKNISVDDAYVKPTLDQTKIDEWQQKLNAQEIRVIEKIQGPLLKKLGYSLQNSTTSDFAVLTLFQKIKYKQLDSLKLLFRKKRTGMKAKQVISYEVPLKQRIHLIFKTFTREILSFPIFKAWNSNIFYKQKEMK